MTRIVFAGREVWPFVEGGGIGRYVWTAAGMLARRHDVAILTTATYAGRREDSRLPPGVELIFVEEPEGDVRPLSSTAHAWSVRLLEAVREISPDIVEFGDYLGEGFATVHARRSGDPDLRTTAVLVRAHTSGEMAMALNEAEPSPANALIWAMERFCIRFADAFLWPGGDVLERYRAFYGRVAEPRRLALPVPLEDLRDPPAAPPLDGPLKLLFLNRIERRKGVLELVEALLGSQADTRLTIVGGDTMSGPHGRSLREHIQELVGGDERVELRGRVPHDAVPGLIAEHHAVAVPVRWETFSYVAREALAANRPVLATPSGAIPDVVIPGRSGWLTRDLRAAIDVVDAAGAVSLSDRGGPRSALEDSLLDDEQLAAAYTPPVAAWRPPRPAKRIGAVVAVRPGDADLDRTLRSLAAQRGVRVGVTLVTAPAAVPAVPSLLRADRTLICDEARVRMWAAGALEAPEELLLLVSAGTELDPRFVRRALEALTDEFSYVTVFVARGRRPWHAPIGGEDLAATGLDAGASVALVRRSVVRVADSERELWSGLAGVVIQEPLVRRLPRRAEDTIAPSHGGAPAPGSVAAAFGDLLTASTTA